MGRGRGARRGCVRCEGPQTKTTTKQKQPSRPRANKQPLRGSRTVAPYGGSARGLGMQLENEIYTTAYHCTCNDHSKEHRRPDQAQTLAAHGGRSPTKRRMRSTTKSPSPMRRGGLRWLFPFPPLPLLPAHPLGGFPPSVVYLCDMCRTLGEGPTSARPATPRPLLALGPVCGNGRRSLPAPVVAGRPPSGARTTHRADQTS